MRRLHTQLFILFFVTFAYFHHTEPGWNVNSRLSLTYALVEKGTFRIDDYWQKPETETNDVADFGGHHYSDKVIGVSLLGIPAFAAVRLLELARNEKFPAEIRRYTVTLFSVGIAAAFLGVFLFRLLMLESEQMGRSSASAAMLLPVILMFGTQLLFYATLFMSYLPACLFLVWALLRFEKWRNRPHDENDASRPPMFSCGVLLGLAVLCEYTAAIAAAWLAMYFALEIRRKTRFVLLVTGGVLALLPFFLYTFLIFGRLAIPYQFEHFQPFREYMARGIMGTTAPRPVVLWLITFHPFRGLFMHSPFLIFSLFGLIVMFRSPTAVRLMLRSPLMLVSYLLFNSGYYMWWGGWSFGPRHLIPVVPFLGIPLLYSWRFAWGRYALLFAGAAAVCIHLVVNVVDPQFPDINFDPAFKRRMPPIQWLLNPSWEHDYTWTFPKYILPQFLGGGLDWNLGSLVGLRGVASIFPLLVFWTAMGLWISLGSLRGPRNTEATNDKSVALG